MRLVSALIAVAVVAVFLLPSTIAICTAVNGMAWDLQDLSTFPSQLLAPALSAFSLNRAPLRPAIALKADVTHAIAYVPLFELDCALIR